MLRELDATTLAAINVLLLVLISTAVFGFKTLLVLALCLTPLVILGLILIARGDFM